MTRKFGLFALVALAFAAFLVGTFNFNQAQAITTTLPMADELVAITTTQNATTANPILESRAGPTDIIQYSVQNPTTATPTATTAWRSMPVIKPIVAAESDNYISLKGYFKTAGAPVRVISDAANDQYSISSQATKYTANASPAVVAENQGSNTQAKYADNYPNPFNAAPAPGPEPVLVAVTGQNDATKLVAAVMGNDNFGVKAGTPVVVTAVKTTVGNPQGIVLGAAEGNTVNAYDVGTSAFAVKPYNAKSVAATDNFGKAPVLVDIGASAPVDARADDAVQGCRNAALADGTYPNPFNGTDDDPTGDAGATWFATLTDAGTNVTYRIAA